MTREIILQTAMQRYATYGIKGVSMDDIAQTLRISKRTLYCNFKSKEELILESIRTETASMKEMLEKYVQESPSAFQALLLFKRELRARNISLCSAFRRDLLSFTEAYSIFLEFRTELYRRSKELLERSVQEGMLVRDQNYDLIARIYAKYVENTPMQYELILTLLRGSCTPQGKELLNQFQYKDN